MTASLLRDVDWGIVAVFALLVLLEGLRRVPAGALVLRGTGAAGWSPLAGPEPRARWRLISWWPPLAPALVVPALEGPATLGPADLDVRLQVARRVTPWLVGGAAATLVTLIIGLPLATARFGGVGFLAGAAVVLALAVTNACAGALALRRLDSRGSRAQVLAWCSPFAAGRVLEGVYEAALAGASQAQAVRALSGEAAFARWSRPRAYDVVYAGIHDPDLCAAADLPTLKAIAAAPPADPTGGNSFCPRCAATWRMPGGECPSCAATLTSLQTL